MAATDKTTNYELPLYKINDKVQMLDGHNRLAQMTDTELKTLETNVSDTNQELLFVKGLYQNVKDDADAALASAVAAESLADSADAAATAATTLATNASSAAATALNKSENALTQAGTAINDSASAKTDATTALTASSSAQSTAGAAMTAAQNALNRFPVVTTDIQDGSITASKIAPTAISALVQNLDIRYFDSTDVNADNEGMVVPNGYYFKGFYIVDLKILVIVSFAGEGAFGHYAVTLPSYVQKPASVSDSHSIVLIYESGSITTFYGARLNTDGKFGVVYNVTSGQSCYLAGAAIFALAPNNQGISMSVPPYESFENESGVI